jgi:hypothetical protein
MQLACFPFVSHIASSLKKVSSSLTVHIFYTNNTIYPYIVAILCPIHVLIKLVYFTFVVLLTIKYACSLFNVERILLLQS